MFSNSISISISNMRMVFILLTYLNQYKQKTNYENLFLHYLFDY